MKSIKVRLIVFFMILIAVGALVTGFIVYRSYLQFLDDSIVQRLSSAVHVADAAIDFSRSAELFEDGADESEYYLENVETIHFLNEKLNMEYIYSMSQDSNGSWFFLLDSGDFNAEPEDMTYMYELDEIYEGLLAAVETGELFIDDGYATDEWGTFRSAFLPIYDKDGNLVTVIGSDIEASEIQGIKKSILIQLFAAVLIGVVITGFCAVWISGRIVKPLEKATESLKEIASGNGDLTKRLDKKADDELGKMVDSYNKFLDMVNGMLLKIVDSTDELQLTGSSLMTNMGESASSVEEITANIVSIKRQVQNQSDSVEDSSAAVSQINGKIDNLGIVIGDQSASITESSAAIEQMVGNITAVSNNMETLSGLFSELKVFSGEGKVKIAEVLSQVNSISEQSESLQEANTIISSIAARTNLLAMNAAIEAAHAGEAGRGFSVVSDEIRKLAEQSAVQSKTIGNSLKGVLESIKSVVVTTSETEKTFEKVINHVQVIGPLELEVNNALTEQKSGSGQILEALSTMKQVTVDVRDGSTEMKISSDLLQNEIKKLNEINSEVTQSMVEVEVGAAEIQSSTISGKKLMGRNQASIESVMFETGKFKLKK